jgi:hypothetical protein
MRKAIAMWTFSKITMLIFLFTIMTVMFTFIYVFYSNLLTSQARDITISITENVRFISHLRGETSERMYLPPYLGLTSGQLGRTANAYWFPQAQRQYYIDFYVIGGKATNPCNPNLMFAASVRLWPLYERVSAASLCLPSEIKKVEFHDIETKQGSCFGDCNHTIDQVDNYMRYLIMLKSSGLLCFMECRTGPDTCDRELKTRCGTGINKPPEVET